MHRIVLVALTLLLLAGCGGTRTVSLEDLVADAEGLDGETVSVSGVVVEFGPDQGALERHFVIQDGADHRVQLVPDEEAEPYVGHLVTVEGQFAFDPTSGRQLTISAIERAGGEG